MSNGRTYVTIQGNVVADPEPRTTKNDATFATFRVGVTSRSYVREHDAWFDAETSFYRVGVFGAQAINVLNCVRKGQPVLVTGHQAIREWAVEDGPTNRDVQITAEAVGHSLVFGRSEFQKVARPVLDLVSERSAEQSGSDESELPAYRVSEPVA